MYADFFDCVGQHYLVIGDRLSSWSDVFQAPKGSPQAGSSSLISCLCIYFSCFGVPEELSSDGGPNFKSNATQDFRSKWVVHDRLSSAYYAQFNGRAGGFRQNSKTSPSIKYGLIRKKANVFCQPSGEIRKHTCASSLARCTATTLPPHCWR